MQPYLGFPPSGLLFDAKLAANKIHVLFSRNKTPVCWSGPTPLLSDDNREYLASEVSNQRDAISLIKRHTSIFSPVPAGCSILTNRTSAVALPSEALEG